MTRLFGFFLLFTLSACAVSPAKRFPEFHANPNRVSKMAVAIDLVITSDIDGSIDGIYDDATRHMAPLAGQQVRRTLQQRGFTVPTLHVNSGLVGVGWPEFHYAKDDKSTGERVSFPMYSEGAAPWSDEDVRRFLSDAVAKARHAGQKDTPSKAPKKYQDVSLKIPPSLQQLNAESLLVVSVVARDVGIGKTIGVALLSSIPSVLLLPVNGGYIYSSMMASGVATDAALVDLKSGDILWHNSFQNAGGTSGKVLVQPALSKLFQPFPKRVATSGEKVDLASSDNLALFHSELDAAGETGRPRNAFKIKADLHEGVITKELYVASIQTLKYEYTDRKRLLDQQLRGGVITRYQFDLEELQARWRFQGAVDTDVDQIDIPAQIADYHAKAAQDRDDGIGAWTILKLKKARTEKQISNDEYRALKDKVDRAFDKQVTELKSRLKSNAISRGTYDVELLKAGWLYRGVPDRKEVVEQETAGDDANSTGTMTP